ncbi:MAG: hypothetical protein J5994_01605 [Ruminococcus sp.]|nr:hypothetical protein [Ruminococcus sp.]
MISVIIEAVWLTLKKLFGFFGFSMVLIIVLIVSFFAVPEIARDKARREVYFNDDMEFISLEELPSEDDKRVFKLKVKNNDSLKDNSNSFTIRDENGETIYGDFKTEYSDLRLMDHVPYCVKTPPGGENVFWVYIDDYKLEGTSKIYLSGGSDFDEDYYGKEFDIKKIS